MERVSEPALMEEEEQCLYYNQSLVDNDSAINRFIEQYKEYIDIENGTIIDLGSGSANFIVALCKTFPKLKAICYEASDAMIRLAKINIANNALEDRITIVKDDFFNATGNFDVVIANRVLHHVDDTERFWNLLSRLSNNVLVSDLERPKSIEYIRDWFDKDVRNSFMAAYTVAEVKQQTDLFGYNIVREEIGHDYYFYTVYQKR